MNWYFKTYNLFSFADSLSDAISNLSLSQDVQNYILSIPDNKTKGKVFNYVKQNQNATLDQIKQWQIENERQSTSVDPYLPREYQIANGLPQKAQKWALANLKKLRNSNLDIPQQNYYTDPQYFDYGQALTRLEQMARTNELNDLLRFNENYDINSKSIEDVHYDIIEWHQVAAGKGEGLMKGPVDQNLIVHGPNNWENPDFNGWTIQEVRSENDLKCEGNEVGHCVGEYYEEVQHGDIKIFSLRDPSNKSHVTIESTNEANPEITQIHGNGPKTGNVQPRSEYKKAIGEWLSLNPEFDFAEEQRNPYLAQIDEGRSESGEEFSEILDKAIDYNPYKEYGITNEKSFNFISEIYKDDNYDVDSLYDYALDYLKRDSTRYRGVSPDKAFGIGEPIGKFAVQKDRYFFSSPHNSLNSDSKYENEMHRVASRLIFNDFRNKYLIKIDSNNRRSYDRSLFFGNYLNLLFSDKSRQEEAFDLLKDSIDEDTFNKITYNENITPKEQIEQLYYAYENKMANKMMENFQNNDPQTKLNIYSKFLSQEEEKSQVGEIVRKLEQANEKVDTKYENVYSEEEADSEEEIISNIQNEDVDYIISQEAYEHVERELKYNPIKLPPRIVEMINEYPELKNQLSIARLQDVTELQEKQSFKNNWYVKTF